MKVRVGELEGKPIITSEYADDVTENEILIEENDNGIILKHRNSNGELVPLNDSDTTIVTIRDTYDVSIVSSNIIKGPSKWAKGSSYLFYINKNESFTITNDITGEDMTSNANLVATGTTDKVYEIQSVHCTPITINEAL